MFKFVKAFVKTKTIEMSLENLIYLDFTKDTISQNVIEYIQDRILIEEEKISKMLKQISWFKVLSWQ